MSVELLCETRDASLIAASTTFLTATLDPDPANLRSDVSCQNGVLLLVVVNERRHLGHMDMPLITDSSQMVIPTMIPTVM